MHFLLRLTPTVLYTDFVFSATGSLMGYRRNIHILIEGYKINIPDAICPMIALGYIVNVKLGEIRFYLRISATHRVIFHTKYSRSLIRKGHENRVWHILLRCGNARHSRKAKSYEACFQHGDTPPLDLSFLEERLYPAPVRLPDCGISASNWIAPDQPTREAIRVLPGGAGRDRLQIVVARILRI